jgi:hypothetical protein
LNRVGGTGSIAAALWVMLLLLGSINAIAADRAKGNSWTYDLIMYVEVEDIEVEVSGAVTYEQVESRSVQTGSGEIDANVMVLGGELSGSKYSFGELAARANVTVDGLMYETVSGGGVVKEVTHLLIDATLGAGGYAEAVLIGQETVISYSPPLLSMFEGKWKLGETWSETTSRDSVTTILRNGILQDQETDNRTVTYEIVVGQSAEYVETPNHTFNSEKITIIDHSGGVMTWWWSDAVDNFVKKQFFRDNSSEPYMTMTLSDWHKSRPSLVAVYVGLASVSIGSVVLAVVIMKNRGDDSRRQPPDPQSYAEVHQTRTQLK